MGDFAITPLDAGLVGLVLLLTQQLKGRLLARWIPLLPVVLAFILVAPAVIVAQGQWPGFPVFISQVLLEGLKTSTLAMTTFKIHRTTVKGR